MKMKRTFLVYMATNVINGKRYIGATRQGLSVRRLQHESDARSSKKYGCPVFRAALKKYGSASFKWTVIARLKSLKQMLHEEVRLIADLRPEYNITPGGEGAVDVRSRPVTCLTDGKLFKSGLAAARFYGFDPNRIAQLCRQGGTTMSGLAFKYTDQEAPPVKRVRTDAEREHHRQQVLAALERGQIRIKKRVVLVESGETFDSIADAARRYRLNEKELYFYIERGERCQGFTFRKLNDAGAPIVVEPQRVARRVICLTDLVIYNSVLEASKKYGVNRAKLTSLCAADDDSGVLDGRRFCFLDQWCPNPE
jgi:hypothetical protein